jgi:anti-sigma B factor antagonist
VRFQGTCREVSDVAIVDFSGQITLGEGSATLRRMIREIVAMGHRKIILNLSDVDYIDSAGIGELVSAYSSLRKVDGELKIMNLSRRLRDIIQITRLYTIFDVQADEQTAIRSFKAPS